LQLSIASRTIGKEYADGGAVCLCDLECTMASVYLSMAAW